ncbi:MAG: hypothetical protein K2X64_04930 [Rhodocyclaceae bacterium]|nr:hypothetical protein [Rhodocyclaceae bacterium]
MKLRTTFLTIIITALLLCSYPAFVLGYTWSHVASAGFPGGRHGPLDAYRHTLASAVVAYTLSPRTVEWITLVMESSAKRSSAMDRHNNRIGATIGSKAQSFSDIQPMVYDFVKQGAIEATDPNQIAWLPPVDWRAGWLW